VCVCVTIMVYKDDEPLFFSHCNHSTVFFVLEPEALLLRYYYAIIPFLD